MAEDVTELDKLQLDYQTAVNAWVAAIRREEARASSAEHSTTEIDAWEEDDNQEEEARNRAKEAKSAYEDALREKFFHF